MSSVNCLHNTYCLLQKQNFVRTFKINNLYRFFKMPDVYTHLHICTMSDVSYPDYILHSRDLMIDNYFHKQSNMWISGFNRDAVKEIEAAIQYLFSAYVKS